MMAKTYPMALVLAGLLAAVVTGPAAAADKAEKGSAPYVHVVIFYLKPEAPSGAVQEMIADAHELLAKIPSVRGVQAGRPAAQATPDLAQKDYQVGLVVLFDNYDGLKTYLDHPLHTKYVEKHGKHVEMKKLQIYDFINQQK
jgi:hypothetical protein